MLNRYYYTDKEVDKLCKSITILVDSREKSNEHIIQWLEKNKVPWKTKAMKQGDYSFMIPANSDLNIDRDLYFDHEIMVERKHNLDEVAGNFTTYRSRFEEEFSTFPGRKKYLLLEQSTYGDVVKGNYRSQISTKAFLASLHTFNHRYNVEIVYMPDNAFSAAWLYGTFIYYLKNNLR